VFVCSSINARVATNWQPEDDTKAEIRRGSHSTSTWGPQVESGRFYSAPSNAGCDLPGGWEGSTHPFVLFDPVREHYE